MGGGGFMMEDASPLDELMLSLSRKRRPRVCLLATPLGDKPDVIVRFYEAFCARACEPSHLPLFGAPVTPADHLARQDVVYVSGGNTANALAVWRLHGVDCALREAWERGAVVGGLSAGANCWFECSVTDSFGPQLEPLHDGLGILPGSFCPHYDGEKRRRAVYTALVRGGFPPGYAADDGAALVFENRELREVVASRPYAGAYRVGPEGEVALEARLVSTASRTS